MPAVITSLCVGVLCGTPCVDVCPFDAIHGPISMNGEGVMQVHLRGERPEDGRVQLYVDPDWCDECGACQPECPADAIFFDFEDAPLTEAQHQEMIRNANFSKGR